MAFPEKLNKTGLIWIGEQYYKTADEFLQEARTMGISRRISTVPRGFEPGKTWVLLAHRKGYRTLAENETTGTMTEELNEIWTPAIFSVFRPTAVEYVVHGGETQEELERLAGRGLVPVRVRNKVPFTN